MVQKALEIWEICALVKACWRADNLADREAYNHDVDHKNHNYNVSTYMENIPHKLT